jgi:Flp pilus assembly protein TadB
MEDLGDLGFWLAAGIVAAAAIVAHGLKEREKERQKQETFRALLTAEGAESRNTTEILAYMRERDAIEQKREDDLRAASNRGVRKVLAVLAGLIAGVVVFLIGVRIANGADISGPVGLAPLVVGPLVAFLVYILIRGKKNVPPPGA